MVCSRMLVTILFSVTILPAGTVWAEAAPVPAVPGGVPTPPAASDAVPVAPPGTLPPAATTAAAAAVTVNPPAPPAAPPTNEQLNTFKSIYENATKIFGDEHTVISPSFFYATDIKGRLSMTDKHEAGISALLLLPLVGFGGGHGADWWPVIVSSDETNVYQAFLGQLSQYQQAQVNVHADAGSAVAISQTKWNIQTLVAAKQLFCQEDLDFPASVEKEIAKLCSGDITPVVTGTPTPDQHAIIAAVTSPATPKDVLPRRHNVMLGPSLGIPLTKNPTDIFQLGASAEIGGAAFRFMATGGLVGRYSGATYKDIFAAGWFVGIALSGEIGDELFHYFNGGSALMAQLASLGQSLKPPSP
jgi:hypothetical protein